MGQPIIAVSGIGKRYKLGAIHGGRTYKTMRDALAQIIRSPAKLIFKNNVSPKKNTKENNYIWALKDISFDVQRGEVLGIIGRNGAGKSTMLKIISQITDPTEGEIRLRGRVASLLEVGTGFHPELTGRENVYLNGAILGMTRNEIKKRFDEIIDFAGVDKFLDTPVKRFSSGMYVRLAFAVAAHLEPEILIVDEVLAVGDYEFQKKCLGKMQDVSQKKGRTVLFVSHNMGAIQSLCNRVILLDTGKKISDGKPNDIIKEYLDNCIGLDRNINLCDRTDRTGTGIVRSVSFDFLDPDYQLVNSLKSGEDYIFRIGYFNNSKKILDNVVCSFSIHDETERTIMLLRTTFSNHSLQITPGYGYIYCKINALPLAIGTYHFTIFISFADMELFDLIGNVKYFEVEGGDFFGTGNIGLPGHCKILTKAEWFTKQ